MVFALSQSGANDIHFVEDQQFAILDNAHSVANGFNVEEVMGGENDCLALPLKCRKIMDDEKRGQWIETGIGFIENQQFGVMKQRARNGCFALHSFGELASQFMFVG